MIDVPRKHHYVPQFLLSQWTGGDGRLVRYEMPFGGKLVHSRRYPSEVGFVRDLYRYPDADIELQQWPELGLFQKIDDAAATVLRKMLLPEPDQIDASDRARWAVFVRSLMHRSPEYLKKSKAAVARINYHLQKEVGEHYSQLRTESDPPTFEDFKAQEHPDEQERKAFEMLPSILTHQRIAMFVVNMEWQIVHLGRECPELLVSDKLLARSNGIGVGLGHMAMPISPRRLLILANNTTTLKAIQAMSARKMATEMNRWTVEGARHFVASTNRAQERFIQNRFGTSLKPSIFDNLDRIDELYASGDVIRSGRARRATDRSASPR